MTDCTLAHDNSLIGFFFHCSQLLLRLTGSGSRLITSRMHCADSRGLGVTVLRIQNLAQVMSPTRLSTTRSSMSKRLSTTEDSQIPEFEDKFLFYPATSHCCLRLKIMLKSLAMPQEADLDDEQFRALLASPRYLPDREASAER